MLSKYIKSLIDIHSRVIVPDLGAFMLKGDSSKTIYFNEFLRFNDGLLVDYISDQEQIEKIEAAKKVKSFVDNINKSLSGNKSVELEGLGALYLDINEKIQLKTSEENTIPPVKQPEREVETSPREILFELEKSEPEVATPKVETPVSSTPIQETPASSTTPMTEPQVQPIKASKPEPAPKAKQAVPSVSNEKEAPSPKNTETISHVPNTTGRMIFVGVFGVVIIAAIVYFSFFRVPKKDANVNQNITIGAENRKDSATLANDSQTLAENKAVTKKTEGKPVKEEKAKEVSKKAVPAKNTEIKAKTASPIVQKSETPKSAVKSANGKKFYVIAGTFSVEANADRMVKKLKEEGFSPDKIRNDNKNVFYVSYSSFGDRESAKEEMKKLKTSGKAETWIYNN